MSLSYRSSRPCNWNVPRQSMHASERYMRHGKVLPMEYAKPSLWDRLKGRRG